MTSKTTTESTNAHLNTAIGSIAEVIVRALEGPLRAQVQASIQSIVEEATQDIHARIVAAVGQIQPISIPINLFAQPTLQVAGPAVGSAPAMEQPPIHAAAPPQPERPSPPDLCNTPQTVISKAEPEWAPPSPKNEPIAQPNAPSVQAAPPLPVAKKPVHITVVGLLPGQAHMIKNEFKFLKLSFISSDAGGSKKLSALAKTNDYVVQMVDFIRHAVGDTIKAANGNWIYVNGGMTSLREKLRELHQQSRPKMLSA